MTEWRIGVVVDAGRGRRRRPRPAMVYPEFRGVGGLESVGGRHWSWLWCLGHVDNPGELPEPQIATLTGR